MKKQFKVTLWIESDIFDEINIDEVDPKYIQDHLGTIIDYDESIHRKCNITILESIIEETG